MWIKAKCHDDLPSAPKVAPDSHLLRLISHSISFGSDSFRSPSFQSEQVVLQ